MAKVKVVALTLAGRRLELDMETQCTVLTLKRKIADHWKLPPLCQSVALGQRKLEDSHVLASLQLAGGGTPLNMTIVISNEQLYERALGGDINQREMAVDDLAQVADRDYDRALQVLSQCMRDRIQKVRIASVNVLAKVARKGEPRAIDTLRDCLADRSKEVRMDAVEALRRLLEWGDGKAIGVFDQCLAREVNPQIRCAAVEVLGDLTPPGDARGVEVFISCMDDKHPGVRRIAADALARVAVGAAQPASWALGKRLKDREWEVRAASLRALASVHAMPSQSGAAAIRLDCPVVLSAVRNCLDDEEAAIRKDAALFLARVDPALVSSVQV